MCEAFAHFWITYTTSIHGIVQGWKICFIQDKGNSEQRQCASPTSGNFLLRLFIEYWVTRKDEIQFAWGKEVITLLWVGYRSHVNGFLELRLLTDTQGLVLWTHTADMERLGYQMLCMGIRRSLVCCYWTFINVSSFCLSLKLSICGVRWNYCFYEFYSQVIEHHCC